MQIKNSDGSIVKSDIDEFGRGSRIVSERPEKVEVLVGGDVWNYTVNEMGGTNEDPFYLKFIDFIGEPIVGLECYLLDKDNNILITDITDNNGEVEFTYQEKFLPILGVKKFDNQDFKPICYINHHYCRQIILISPKIKQEVELIEEGGEGNYLRARYKVQEGETLTSISQKFNITVDELCELNDSVMSIDKTVVLTKGKLIKLPSHVGRMEW